MMSDTEVTNVNAESDDEVVLPSDTLDILNQFLQDKEEREKLEQKLSDEHDLKKKNFEENWQLSQFWYNHRTKEILAALCLNIMEARSILEYKPIDTRIALLSCPSLYESVKVVNPNGNVQLFEYDERFSVYGPDFTLYDYNEAISPDYLKEFHDSFDIIIVDPPFLSEECIKKMSIILKNFSKVDTKIILCSGEVVADWAKKYMDLDKCRFQPEHERNLGNAFASYANFNLDELVFIDNK